MDDGGDANDGKLSIPSDPNPENEFSVPGEAGCNVARSATNLPAPPVVQADTFSYRDAHSFNRGGTSQSPHSRGDVGGRWKAGPNWHQIHWMFAVYLPPFFAYSGRALLVTVTRLFRLLI